MADPGSAGASDAAPSPTGAAAGATLDRYYGYVLSGLNGIGTVWIFVMMILINADVIGRAVFNAPIRGVPLIISLSIIAIVFLQLADALRNGRMTRNEVMLARFGERGSIWFWLMQGFFHLAGAATMALVIWYGYPLFEKAWIQESYFGNLNDFTFAEWPILGIVLIGALAVGLQFLILLKNDIVALSRRASAGILKFIVFTVIVIGAIVAGRYALMDQTAIFVGVFSVVLMLALVYLGMHVGVALALISFFCVLVIRDSSEISGKMLALAANESLRQYELGVIPLFVLMGMFVAVSDVGRDAFTVAHQLFRRLRGGLGTATVAANAVFAAITGTSIASASVFTRIAVPEMLRIGYKSRFAVGVVAGSSVLGMLIPPSLLLIIFGILSETSIGDLFIAGIIPGILLAVAYAVMIWVMATSFPKAVYESGVSHEGRRRKPKDAPASSQEGATEDEAVAARATAASATAAEAAGEAAATETTPATDHVPVLSGIQMLIKVGPILGLIVFILAGIYGGIFTATEAGGVGALGAFLIALARRKLSFVSLWRVLVETGYVTAALCFLLVAAHLYARMITVSGIPGALEEGIATAGLGYYGLIAVYVVLLIILGTILDSASIMLILVPILAIIIKSMEMAGADVDSMVWFGIVTVLAVEIGLLTPPVGLACFAIYSNLNDPRITLNDVFWGAAPFALTMFVVLLLIIAFPWLAMAML